MATTQHGTHGAGASEHAAVTVDAAGFEKVIGSDKPVVVDFWATWCPPCRILAPTLEQVASATRGRAVVAKLDVDGAQELARQYRVQAIPTLVFFKDGKEVDRLVGVHSREEIERRLVNAGA